MRALNELRGLRFPDDYVIKMFFKEGLHRKVGRVLELGCGSGNNLLLFDAFGWELTGVDNNPSAIADARHNLMGAGTLIECDLSLGLPALSGQLFDVVLMPSVNYYIPRAAFVRILAASKDSLRAGGIFYIRSRLPEDWRWGRGTPAGPGAYHLTCTETGEHGLLNVFYSADELSDLIRSHFGELRGRQRLCVTYDNPQGGTIVRNADVVIWGKAADT